MTAEKRTDAAPKTASATGSTRKAWTPKSTIEVVLEQIGKQEKRVADLQKALDAEKTSLNKLLQAKKVLEAS
jgi:tetrahydromethanopterin S-methyltransferase subunit B